MTVVYLVCYFGVLLLPGIRDLFMQYALHTKVSGWENVMSLTTLITGVVVWDVLAAVGVGLFATVYNQIKK
ncbi:DUF5676 family membrane protein [Patescibacteria group bacterium]|nr:DUF5676 family membrane protein [Patescibacteria group bacterium]